MTEARSLADPQIFSQTISVVVADIDHTLVDFDRAHEAGINSLVSKFGAEFSRNVSNIFMLIMEEHQHKNSETWDKKTDFEKLLAEISEIEKPSLLEYGLKRWSRESWMIIAGKRLGIKLTKTNIEECRDTYWKNLSQNSFLYEDAKVFLDELKKRKIPLILMTSGDSLMQVNDDLTLRYEPDFSQSYKMKRVNALPLHYESIILGETVDKPNLKFFDLVYQELNKLGNFDKKTVLFVGDSPKSDLMVPENDGYKSLLVKR